MNEKKYWLSDLAVALLAVIISVFLAAKGDSYAFMTCFLTIGCIVIIHAAFYFFKFPIPYFMYALILVFIVMAMIFGKMLDFYTKIPLWDFYLHLVSGAVLAFVGYLFYYHMVNFKAPNGTKKSLPGWFVFLFASASAGIWEIYEFAGDFIFGLQSQGGSLTDTMTDIIAGNLGCLVALIFIIRHERGKPVGFLSHMIENAKEARRK